MGAGLVVASRVFGRDPAKVVFVEDYDMVEAIPSD